jgi:hypothetical protein
MQGQSSPSGSTDEGFLLSLSDSTRNAKSLQIQAKMLAQALSRVIGSGDWACFKDLAAIAGADWLEFGNRLAR